ncbi:MAG: heavy metal translocating P-type ATPase [Candidatus Hodarchaeales archaeon]
MKTFKLKINELDCPSCALTFEKDIATSPGIVDIKISYTAQRANITINEQETNEEIIRNEIKNKGYTIVEKKSGTRSFAHSNTVYFAFVAVVAVLVLVEIVVEGLGSSPLEDIPPLVMIAATLIGGYPIFRGAFRGLKNKQINADLLMTVAISAALFINELHAAILVVFFMSIAHFLERFTMSKSREAIKELVEQAPRIAIVKRDGEEIEVPIDEITIGDVVMVKPGEKIPVDGMVVKGSSSVNQSSITGESMPVEKTMGEPVYAGSLNQGGVLHVKTDKIGEDTTLGRIIKLVEEAETAKADVQKFADKYSTYYLPAVLVAAVITLVVTQNPVSAIAVLVVSCPCAVALATPVAVVASAGSSAKHGIIIKGGIYLELLARIDHLVVDKTGTLTHGKPRVTDIISFGCPEEEVLQVAASLEKNSEHPLASAILQKSREKGIQLLDAGEFKYEVGRGITGKLSTVEIAVGNDSLMREKNVEGQVAARERKKVLEQAGKTVVHVVRDNSIIGLITFSDTIRQDVKEALKELKDLGIDRVTLLTGDNERIARKTAEELDIDDYKADLLPGDKIACIKKLQARGSRVLMIGDGVNDAPALTQADVGIAMGSGTEIAMETSNVILMQDEWKQLPEAVKTGRRTFRTIKENITFGIAFNITGLLLASVGILTPVFAALAQSLPDVLVFLNSSKLLRRSG